MILMLTKLYRRTQYLHWVGTNQFTSHSLTEILKFRAFKVKRTELNQTKNHIFCGFLYKVPVSDGTNKTLKSFSF